MNTWCGARFLDDAGGEAATTVRRHSAFKIIPRVTHGSWMVKQAVGQNTPVLLGRKITTKYFRCARAAMCTHTIDAPLPVPDLTTKCGCGLYWVQCCHMHHWNLVANLSAAPHVLLLAFSTL